VHIIFLLHTPFQIYTLHKMQHLALVLYKEYPQTCTLLCIKIIVHALFDCSIRVYRSILYLMWWIYSSMSTASLIRICKTIKLEPYLLNRTIAVTLWYDHNILMIIVTGFVKILHGICDIAGSFQNVSQNQPVQPVAIIKYGST